MAQFPLNMGKADTAGRGSQIVALTLDSAGEVNYEAILTQNLGSDRMVRASYKVGLALCFT